MKRILAVILFALPIMASEPTPTAKLFSLLLWGFWQVWPLAQTHQSINIATNAIAAAEADHVATSNLVTAIDNTVSNDQIWTISVGWPMLDRTPVDDRQNVMGEEVWRDSIWIDGELWHDHYIQFNAQVSTNPTVLSIEYSARDDEGVVQRWNANISSNSYPATVPIVIGTNSYSCYMFRNKVPPAITNSVIDWDREVIFGAPEGSGRGFSIEGVFIVDRDGYVWIGRNYTNIIDSVTNIVINGLEIEQ